MVGEKTKVIIGVLIVTAVGWLTYGRNYHEPAALFWDENYHIAAAEKYKYNVMFMEPHPPLGKQLILLGDQLIGANEQPDTSTFIRTDHIDSIPAGYSFAGVRFVPTIAAVLAGPIFFLILYQISDRLLVSGLFSSLYLFENALIVHSRGAMLDSIQIFFFLSTLLYWLVIRDKERLHIRHYALLVALIGATAAIKLSGLVLLLLLPPLVIHHVEGKTFSEAMSHILGVGTAICALLTVFVGSYYIHIARGTRVQPGRTYEASERYLELIRQGKAGSLSTLPVALRDHLAFIPHYERGVPAYDPKKEGENGSLPYVWPFGGKAINYRWESDESGVRYLYLMGNPVIWDAGVVSIGLAGSLMVSRLIFNLKLGDRRLFEIIRTLLLVYVVYMAVMFMIDRVLYLYHYFLPLLLSLIIGFALYNYIFEEAIRKRSKRLAGSTVLFVALVILVYLFFKPLTYYEPLTRDQFQLRQWFDFWQLVPV